MAKSFMQMAKEAMAQVEGISAEEVQIRLAALARDPLHKDSFRALELMAKIHGLMSDKVDITLTRKDLQTDVGAAIGQLAAISARKPPQLAQKSQ